MASLSDSSNTTIAEDFAASFDKTAFWNLYAQYGIVFTVLLVGTWFVAGKYWRWRCDRAYSHASAMIAKTPCLHKCIIPKDRAAFGGDASVGTEEPPATGGAAAAADGDADGGGDGAAASGATPAKPPCGCRGGQCVWWIANLMRLITIVPFILLWVWGAAVADELRPQMVGVGIATLWAAFLFWLYAVLLWKERAYRVSSPLAPSQRMRGGGWCARLLPPRTDIAVQMCLAAALLVCIWLFYAVGERISYSGSSMVFLALNMIPMTLIVFWNADASSPELHKVITASKGIDDYDGSVDTETAGAAETDAAAIASAQSKRVADKKKRVSRKSLVAYIAALVILLVYAIVNQVIIDEDAGGGASLGWANFAAVVVLDCMSYLMHRSHLLRSPVVKCTIMTLSRGALVMFGASVWFLGYSAVYAVYGITLCHRMIVRAIPVTDAEAWAASVATGGAVGTRVAAAAPVTAPAAGAATPGGEAGEAKDGDAEVVVVEPELAPTTGRKERVKGFTETPGFVLLVLSFCFAILLVVVALIKPGGLPLASVQLVDAAHEQWEFGVGALAAVLIFAAIFAAYRVHKRAMWLGSSGGADTEAIAAAGKLRLKSGIACEVVILGAGLAMFLVGESYLILASALFIPIVTVSGGVLYTRWVQNDYDVFLHHKHRPVRFLVDGAPAAGDAAAAGGDAAATAGGADAGAAASSGDGDGDGAGEAKGNDADTLADGGEAGDGAEGGAAAASAAAPTVAAPAPQLTGGGGCMNGGADLWPAGMPAGDRIKRLPKAWVSGDFRRMSCCGAFVRCGSASHDYSMLGLIIFGLAAPLAGFALVVWSGFDEAKWVGPFVATEVLVVGLSLVAFSAWFNTLSVSASVIILCALAGVLHALAHFLLWTWEVEDKTGKFAYALLASLVMYPTTALLTAGMYKWRDDKWKLSKPVKIILAASQVPLIGMCVSVLALYDVIAGAALLMLYVLFLVALLVALKWVSNGFYLPLKWRIPAFVAIGVVCVPGIVVGLAEEGKVAFQAFSLSWMCLILVIIVLAISKTVGRSRRLKAWVRASPSVFPVVTYDARRDDLVSANAGVVLSYVAIFGVMAWGVGAVMFLTPVYVGLGTTALTLVVAFVFTMQMSTQSAMRFNHVLRLLAASGELETVVNEARAAAQRRITRSAGGGEVASAATTATSSSAGSDNGSTAGGGGEGGGDGEAKDDGTADAGADAGVGGSASKVSPANVQLDASLDPVKDLQAKAAEVRQLEVEVMRLLQTSGNDVKLASTLCGACGDHSGRDPIQVFVRPAGTGSGDVEAAMAAGTPTAAAGDEDRTTRLVNALARLRELDREVVEHTKRVTLFNLYFEMLTSQAGETRRAMADLRFREFLRWCVKGEPDAKAAIVANDMAVLTGDPDALTLEMTWRWPRDRQKRLKAVKAVYVAAAAAQKAKEEALAREEEEKARERERRLREAEERRRQREIEEWRRKNEEEARKLEEERRAREAEAEAKAAEERRKREEEERQRREAEEAAEEEARRHEEEEARKAAEEAERKRRAEAEAEAERQRVEEERRKAYEEEERRRAEAEAEAQRRAAEAADEEAKRKAEDDARRLREEHEAAERKRQAEAAEAARKAAEEEERRRKAAAEDSEAEKRRKLIEERRRKRQQEIEEARRRRAAAASAREAELQAQREAERRREEEEIARRAAAGAGEGKSFEEIRDACLASGERFVDADFGGDTALWLDPAKPKVRNLEWKPPTEFVPPGKEPVITNKPAGAGAGAGAGADGVDTTGFDASDIAQGQLGDCWLLSAMSVLAGAKTPSGESQMKDVFITTDTNRAGVYAVKLYHNGEFKTVIVDDLIPCRKHGRGWAPAFVSSKSGNELWMCLVEKAYSKLYGSYEAIEGGLVSVGLSAFTGGAAESIDMTKAEHREAIANGSLWETVVRYRDAGYLMGAGSPSGSDTDISDLGIVQGHAYAILAIVEASDSNGTHRLLQLRNPWGQTEWKGPWSDGDTRRWTRRMRAKLKYNPTGDEEKDDDGTFWMSFDDFTSHYRNIYVCRVFRTVEESGSWYLYEGKSEWKGKSAKGVPGNPGCEFNPQWLVKVQRPCTLYISLQQEVKTRGSEYHIGWMLVKKGGARVKNLYVGESVASSGAYTNNAQVSKEVFVEPDSKPYTLFCSTYKAGQETGCSVRVFSDQPLEGDGLTLLDASNSEAD